MPRKITKTELQTSTPTESRPRRYSWDEWYASDEWQEYVRRVDYATTNDTPTSIFIKSARIAAHDRGLVLEIRAQTESSVWLRAFNPTTQEPTEREQKKPTPRKRKPAPRKRSKSSK